jgi:serine/threonine protein kinase
MIMAAITVRCPGCGVEYAVDESHLGKKARCNKPSCGQTFTLSRPAPAEGRPRGGDGVPLTWEPGDVILDLYEVRPFSERTPFVEGGMGRVNCVWHRGWSRLLAVKSVRPDGLASPAAVANFQREAEVWVDRLGLHPHVVSCHYVRLLGGLPRLFMDLVPGGSLQDWVDSGRLYEGGPEEALGRLLDVAIQFAWGLHHAHEQGLIHQDVKPANVLLTPEGLAKVTDFGLAQARVAAGEQAERPAGSTILATWGGMTPAYCSPEQAEVAARVKAGVPREQCPKLTRGTDVWSWAVSVLAMFAGGVAWRSGSVANHHLGRPAQDPRIPRMPPRLVGLLEGCFQRRPEDRPRSLREVAAGLREVSEQATGQLHGREEPQPGELLADSLNNRGVSLYDLGKQPEAEQKWQEALRVDPHHPEATYNWGLIRWRSGRMTDQKLLEKLREVLASSADAERVEYLMGVVHLERTDAKAAVGLLSKAAGAGTGRADITAALALARAAGASVEQSPRIFKGHTDVVSSVSFSPDGRFALSGCNDRTLRLWEVSSGKCLRTFEGHSGEVSSVSFSPDGRFALSGSGNGDGTLRLWEVSSGRCLRTFEGHTSWVFSVSFSPDGRFALSGGDDNTPWLWELDWEFEPNQPADWDEGARPFLDTFLTLQTPYDDGLVRRGKPLWAEDDFRRLLDRLGCAGYGWLRPEGVRRQLDKMAGAWQGPPPLG